MKAITDKLADALRELNDARYVLIDALKQSNYADKTPAFHEALDNARDALAAYDTAQTTKGTVKSNRAWREECTLLRGALRDILAYCVEPVPESPCHADLDTIGGKARDALTQTGVADGRHR